ncbi:competence protein CoiA family protein [Kribbella solani]|uniref:competence protein CoiA family protein n=1 Tax=Kribbella solani TaxID=236067 RepID=UPI0029AADEE3|nr:competence protein CoiA family protein [Kribbella solani]MDX2970971.1 competence protein CoiA family protein [Kribbella solani]
MPKDLLVIGLDLATGHEVQITSQPLEYWKAKGYSGDHSLVCLLCHEGLDLPEPREVPLIVKGRIGGARRHHFSHPPHEAPVGGHGPESWWHAEAKQLIATWARSQPDVAKVSIEHWTPDRRRRTDVQVTLRTGERLAIEVQQQPLTDQAWRARHCDYVAAGLLDVWLWHPATGVPHVAYADGLPGWTLDLDNTAVGVQVGIAARDDVPLRWPPEPGDRTVSITVPLPDMTLARDGLHPPAWLLTQIAAAAAAARDNEDAGTSGPRVTPVPNRTSRPARSTARTAITAPAVDVRRGRVMLFPGGIRPPRSERVLVATARRGHDIYRVDALPPYANLPGLPRYICDCGLVLLSPGDHP